MPSVSYTVQRPGQGPAILNACRSLARATDFDRVTGLYAFATFKGAGLLVAALRDSTTRWQNVSKRWIISIDGGITEPSALRFLMNLRRSEVRVPHAEQLLLSQLRPKFRFHPKTLLLERGISPRRPVGLVVGSANLTFNGLCFGHEHVMSVFATGISTAGVVPKSVSTAIAEVEEVIESAMVIDEDFIARYEAARPVPLVTPPEVEDRRADLILLNDAELPPTQAAALAAADRLWIDIDYVVPNRGKGEEGNQIDMQRGTRVFFGFSDAPLPRNSPIGSVEITYGAHSANRNLRFGNNYMDKLDLPIPDVEGPPSYSNTTLLFTRNAPGSFGLRVGAASEIANWKGRSRAAGTLYRMRSGREFGVF